MGSVKDLVVVMEPTAREMGIGRFDFSDRYSVFDWGEMPNNVPYKGASLCIMSAYFFEQLARSDIKTHYIGLGDDVDRPYSVGELTTPVNKMMIKVVRTARPRHIAKEGTSYGYDYSFYQQAQQNGEGNFIIPLEVIYRNTLPRGSSVFRRLGDGTLTLGEMGLSHQPQEGDVLPRVFIDGSTKYERFDRYPGWDELQELAGLSDVELDRINSLVTYGNFIISRGVSRAGLRNDDGKFEFAFDPNRQLMFADTMGALDECRFTYDLNGRRIDVSKEIPRQWYRRKQPEWVEQIDIAKRSDGDWKHLVMTKPEPLPPALLEILSNVYASAANAVIGRRLFDAPGLQEVVKEYQRFAELEMK